MSENKIELKRLITENLNDIDHDSDSNPSVKDDKIYYLFYIWVG